MKKHKIKTPIGSVFQKDGSFWRIYGYSSTFVNGAEIKHYTVIKCTKTGKEFKMLNVFPVAEIDAVESWPAASDEKVQSMSTRIKQIDSDINSHESEIEFLKKEVEKLRLKKELYSS